MENNAGRPSCQRIKNDNNDKTENIERELTFWQEIDKGLSGQSPPDLRTQAILYAYSDTRTFFGVSLAEVGEEELAQSQWQKAYELSKYNDVAAQFIAQKYLNDKDFDKAIEWYQKAITAQPILKTPHRTLGFLYLEQKNDKKKALDHFQKYLRFAPKSKEADEIRQLIEKLRTEI